MEGDQQRKEAALRAQKDIHSSVMSSNYNSSIIFQVYLTVFQYFSYINIDTKLLNTSREKNQEMKADFLVQRNVPKYSIPPQKKEWWGWCSNTFGGDCVYVLIM